MNKKILHYVIMPTAILLLGIATLSAFFKRSIPAEKVERNSEKINLALRQTAHRLLKNAGDSTSAITPIKKTADNEYLVLLEHHFNYDSLPVFLNNSFKMHDITGNYDVAVWDCEHRELILGYSSFHLSKGEDIPCGGRTQAVKCYNFTVNFTDTPPSVTAQSKPIFNIILGGVGFIVLCSFAYYFYFLNKKKEKTIRPEKPIIDDSHFIYIGNSIFDSRNQMVSIGTIQQKLTFRESKLLHLFCAHKNELLDRDYILKAVWEDEGVLVGRSVDVFVSRLRKLLKHDATLKITNIHARGYRFDVIDA
jgi:Transcriptional regulatory protein, C terminal